jgi:alkylmercury lyase
MREQALPDLAEISQKIADRLTAHRGNFYRSGLWVQLLHLLAEGKPVSVSQLAQAVGRSPGEVARTLACCTDLEVDGQNNILGMGLSLNPTAHRFEVNGHSLYTWCALDTLLYATAMDQTVQVTSSCPSTQSDIILTVSPDGIIALDPATAVISIVIPPTNEACCRHNFCDEGHFFSTAEAAVCGLPAKPEVYILPLKEAFAVGRQLLAQLQAG